MMVEILHDLIGPNIDLIYKKYGSITEIYICIHMYFNIHIYIYIHLFMYMIPIYTYVYLLVHLLVCM